MPVPIRLVQPAEPSPKQAVIERVKAAPNYGSYLQCNRCGCRTVLTTTNGASIKNGRYQRGTLIDDRVCAECWRLGIWTPMLPDKPRIVKEPKPRRTKPKAVK